MILEPLAAPRRRHSLLSAAGPIPNHQGTDWPSSFQSTTNLCNPGVGAWPTCWPSSPLVAPVAGRNPGAAAANQRMGSFAVYAAAPCESAVGLWSADDLRRMAKERLTDIEAALVERTIWSGEYVATDPAGAQIISPLTVDDVGTAAPIPSFSSTAVIPTNGGTPAALLNVLEGLERTAREDHGLTGPVMFHCPSWAQPRFKAWQLGLERVADRYYVGDNQIVFGEGYTSKIGGATAPLGSFWVVLTAGTVEVSLHPEVRVYPENPTLDMVRQNRDVVYAQRFAAYRFDTCCVLAAQAEAC